MKIFSITCGLPATGKSTVAGKLSVAFGMKYISTDDVREKLPEDARTLINANPLARHLVYYHTFAIAESLLHKGRSVIVDGTFTNKIYRKTAYYIAAKTGTPIYVIHVICKNYKLIRERYERRKTNNPYFKEWAEIKSYNNKYVEQDPLEKEALPTGEPVPIIEYDSVRNEANILYSDGSEAIEMILEAITAPERVKV